MRFTLWRHWAVFPTSMRRAIALAFVTVIIASGLLYQTNVRSKRDPEFSRGGNFRGSLTNPGAAGNAVLGIPTPQPSAALTDSRSSASITARDQPPIIGRSGLTRPAFPALSNYVYAIDGWEQATAFGRRTYPSEMTMTVHRTQPTGQVERKLASDEAIFDLSFSPEHEEREIVAYRSKALVFTFEGGSVTFGPVTRTSNGNYAPPMTQIPIPLAAGIKRTGTSSATDDKGEVSRVEDWTVTVKQRERISILGRSIYAWVVRVSRQSRPDSAEAVTRTRTYWFDPASSIWVKWTEKMSGSQEFGPSTFDYQTEYTATLERVEPL